MRADFKRDGLPDCIVLGINVTPLFQQDSKIESFEKSINNDFYTITRLRV